jgi:hypothetical protein
MIVGTPEHASPKSEQPKYAKALEISKDQVDVTLLEVEYAINEEDPDEEFGGTENRRKMEKRLLRRLDIRCAVNSSSYMLLYGLLDSVSYA